MNKIKTLLDELKEFNQNADGSTNAQTIEAPSPLPTKIPTLETGTYQHINKDLEERFAYCGRWINARGGQDWIIPSDMEQVWDIGSDLAEIVEVRLEFHLTAYARSMLTLFAVDRLDYNETYLVWSESGINFEVAFFDGHSQRKFLSFIDYLRFEENS